MPFKFWKREKPEKEKEGPEEKKGAKPASELKAASGTQAGETPASTGAASPNAAPAVGEAPKAEKAPEPTPSDLEAAVGELHAGLVDLGLTIAGTKAVFAKRVAAFPEGTGAFLTTYREAPYRAGTRILADWL